MERIKTVKGKVGRETHRQDSVVQRDWIPIQPLFEDEVIPVIVEPAINGVDIVDWQVVDMLRLDNVSVVRTREPFQCEREVLVAVTEPTGDTKIFEQLEVVRDE